MVFININGTPLADAVYGRCGRGDKLKRMIYVETAHPGGRSRALEDYWLTALVDYRSIRRWQPRTLVYPAFRSAIREGRRIMTT